MEEKLSHIQPYMVEGAELSAERPAPHLLSQQEVMIRAAEYAVQQGYLDPAHPIYEEVPELATAKVAEPIFVYYGDELLQGKVNGHYRIYVADNVGKVLIETNVFAFENLGDRKEPDFSRGIRTSEIPSKKMLSQDNVKQFFSERFPLSQISTPLAVILNMENVDKALTRRVVDFLSGCVFALDGQVKKIAQSTYLFCPHNMAVVGDLENIQGNVESYM